MNIEKQIIFLGGRYDFILQSTPFYTGALIKMVGAFVVGRNIMSMRYEAPEQQRAFYKSKAWQKCRASYISKVGGLCERCLARGIVKPGYIVHHKEYITLDNINDPSILLNHDNLEYLCFDCHQHEHFPRQRRFTVDDFGNVTTKAE